MKKQDIAAAVAAATALILDLDVLYDSKAASFLVLSVAHLRVNEQSLCDDG